MKLRALFKPIGQTEDREREAIRVLEERTRRRSTLETSLPWAAERPGEAHDMVQEVMTHYGVQVEALITMALDQNIEGDELLYKLRELACKVEEDERTAHEEDKYFGRGK